MPRPPATPEERAELRTRLRRAAASIHRDEGIQAVTVRNVTRLAGVSAGSLYNSFSGIDELLRSLWLEPVMRGGPALEAVAASHPDPLERIGALLRSFAPFVRRNPEIHRGALLYVGPGTGEEPDRRPPDELPFHALLRTAVEDGQRSGIVRDGDPARITQLLWSGIHGALGLPVNARLYDLAPGDDVADDMIALLLDAIRI